MAKYIGPKCKLCRREGEKLFLRGDRCATTKCAIVKRNFPPGKTASKGGRAPRLTEYGQQLRAKQKIRRIYGILEEQFIIIFERAGKLSGDRGENFLTLLEKRLDNAIYRGMFAKSRNSARQLITHGHVTVNNKKVDIPSYVLTVGDVISIKEKTKESNLFKNIEKHIKKDTIPGWLSIDEKLLTITVVSLPEVKEMYEPLKIKLVVEFYSR